MKRTEQQIIDYLTRYRSLYRSWPSPSVFKGVKKVSLEHSVALGIAASLKGADVSDYELDQLATHIMNRIPKDVKNAYSWASIVSHNWLMDRNRTIQYEMIRKENQRKQQEEMDKLAAYIEKSKIELRNIIDSLIKEYLKDLESKRTLKTFNLKRSEKSYLAFTNQMSYIWYLYGIGMTDAMAAKRLPYTTRNQRYKWKERGLELIYKRASDSLKPFLFKRPVIGSQRLTSPKYGIQK